MNSQGNEEAAKSIDLEVDLDPLFLDASLSKEELKGAVYNVILKLKNDIIFQKDLKFYAELEMLSKFIHNAKLGLSSLQPEEMHFGQVPAVYDELEEVISATEKATNDILESCEKIQDISKQFDGSTQRVVMSEVIRIFEACNFQDLTGQRISKVVKTLIDIDNKVNAMLFAFGHNRMHLDTITLAKDSEQAEREKNLLLRRSQLIKEAIAQDDVDRLFNEKV